MSSPLTPEQRARLVARYLETGNALATAREYDVDEATVRRAVKRAGAPKAADLHARACARAIREGRRALTGTAKRLRAWLEQHGDPSAPTIEPADLAKLATALRGVVGGVVEVDEHRQKTQLSRLTRELRRAEIELARLKIAAGGVERHELAIVTPDDAAKAAREVFGSPSALEAHGPDEASPQAVAGDVLPVPDPLDH